MPRSSYPCSNRSKSQGRAAAAHAPDQTTLEATKRIPRAETAGTCGVGRSSTRFLNPGTSEPTVNDGAARAAGPPASTHRSTGGATRSSAPSTGSRRSARSPPATTRGPTSSTGRSRSRRSGSGSARDRHGLAYWSSGTRTPSSTSSKTRGHQDSSSSNTLGSHCRARSITSST